MNPKIQKEDKIQATLNNSGECLNQCFNTSLKIG